MKGNKGEWSEPYALLKLIADGKLYVGDEYFNKIEGVCYQILKIIRYEKERSLEFSYLNDIVVISGGNEVLKIPISKFVNGANECLKCINASKKGKGTFELPSIKKLLASLSINTLKAKSKLKNDITIQIFDEKSFLEPQLGFSIKSQLGRPSTLLNASNATNFTFSLMGKNLKKNQINKINCVREFSEKLDLLHSYGAYLKFDKVDNSIFKSNLQTIDYYFDQILSEILILFYSNRISSENSVAKFINNVSKSNPLGYDLAINSKMYELSMKKFLTDYALGMRAAEVWQRDYEATGGYLIVKNDGELICYHFYFMKSFENYLFNNTKLETPDPNRHKFGKIYADNGILKLKLNLQIRFIK